MGLQPLRLANDIPEIGISVHDIAENLDPSRPAIHGRFSGPAAWWTDDSHGLTSLGDCNRIARLLNLVQQGEALGLELGGAHDSTCHDFIVTEVVI